MFVGKLSWVQSEILTQGSYTNMLVFVPFVVELGKAMSSTWRRQPCHNSGVISVPVLGQLVKLSCAGDVEGSQLFRMGPELIGDNQTVPTSLIGVRGGKINHKVKRSQI